MHESLRLLEYTGIVSKRDGGVAATRSEIGNRYAVNIGCLAAMDANPIAYIKELRRQITIKRFTEYGANAQPFASLPDIATQLKEKETTLLLAAQLKKSIRVLDISNWQMAGLERIGLDTIGKALRADEGAYQEIRYVGPKRARNIRNEVVASILEYLSG